MFRVLLDKMEKLDLVGAPGVGMGTAGTVLGVGTRKKRSGTFSGRLMGEEKQLCSLSLKLGRDLRRWGRGGRLLV